MVRDDFYKDLAARASVLAAGGAIGVGCFGAPSLTETVEIIRMGLWATGNIGPSYIVEGVKNMDKYFFT